MTDNTLPPDEVPGPVTEGTPDYTHPDWERKTEIARWLILAYTHEKPTAHVNVKRLSEFLGGGITRDLSPRLMRLASHGLLKPQGGAARTMYQTTEEIHVAYCGQLVTDDHPGDGTQKPMTIARVSRHSAGEYVIPQAGFTVEQYHRNTDYDCSPNERVVECFYGEFTPTEVITEYGPKVEQGGLYAFPEGRLRPPTKGMLAPYYADYTAD